MQLGGNVSARESTAHILSAKMNIMVYVDDREFTYTYVPVVYNYLLVV